METALPIEHIEWYVQICACAFFIHSTRALLAPATAARHGPHEYFSQVRRALAEVVVD